MILPQETVLVGVSGGHDSLTLLYALNALRDELDCSLHVAHLNHCLRPDSAEDAAFVKTHAERLNLPISIGEIDVPQLTRQQQMSVETAARQARYQFYEDISEQIGATKIALGHHRGDQAESILMNLLRGAGATGLKGMLPVRDGKFIRPLLDFSRREIEAFIARLGLQPRQDATNLESNVLRNRIRLELIPLLEQAYNPNLQNGLVQTAKLLRAESDYLETVASEAFEVCRIKDSSPDTVVLDRLRFCEHHLAVQRRILRLAIRELSDGLGESYFSHIESMLKLIEGQSPNTALNLPNDLQFRRTYEQLHFQKSGTSSTDDFAYELTVPGCTEFPQLNARMIASIETQRSGDFPDGKFVAVFDYDRIQSTLTLRNRRAGDRFQPFGMQGTKKVKDFLIDTKVAHQERERIPILVSQGEILWVVGHRTSEQFKVKKETKRCLYLTYLAQNP
jgi:tRNA(Ile)-lysidine synthase